MPDGKPLAYGLMEIPEHERAKQTSPSVIRGLGPRFLRNTTCAAIMLLLTSGHEQQPISTSAAVPSPANTAPLAGETLPWEEAERRDLANAIGSLADSLDGRTLTALSLLCVLKNDVSAHDLHEILKNTHPQARFATHEIAYVLAQPFKTFLANDACAMLRKKLQDRGSGYALLASRLPSVDDALFTTPAGCAMILMEANTLLRLEDSEHLLSPDMKGKYDELKRKLPWTIARQ